MIFRGRPLSMLDESGREWGDVVDELARAPTALDGVAAHLLERWLCVAAGAVALQRAPLAWTG